MLASGTWTAEELVGFTTLGTAAGFPTRFEGGIAVLDVRGFTVFINQGPAEEN